MDNINNYFKTDGVYYSDTSNENQITQKAFLYCLYSYLYDIVPSTNIEAIKLINVFFTAPESDGTNPNDLRDNGFLTFISFLNHNKTTIIKKYYLDLEIFNDSDYITKDSTEYANIIKNLDEIIGKLNDKIVNHSPIDRPLYMLFGYFCLMFIINLICVLCIIFALVRDKRGDDGAFPSILLDAIEPISNYIISIFRRLTYSGLF